MPYTTTCIAYNVTCIVQNTFKILHATSDIISWVFNSYCVLLASCISIKCKKLKHGKRDCRKKIGNGLLWVMWHHGTLFWESITNIVDNSSKEPNNPAYWTHTDLSSVTGIVDCYCKCYILSSRALPVV